MAEFHSDKPLDAGLLTSVTEEFELILLESGAYKVLERRRVGDLLSQVKNEATLRDKPALREEIRRQGAQAVVFGLLQDDVESGQFVFYASLVRLDSSKDWKRAAALPRGKIRDRDSRLEALRKLIPPQGAGPDTEILRVFRHEFIFENPRCTKAEREVTCTISVTNNGEDRVLRLYNTTSMFDESSQRSTPFSYKIGTKSDNPHQRRWVEEQIVRGRTAAIRIGFNGVSSTAETISKLQLDCMEGEGKLDFSVMFRNFAFVSEPQEPRRPVLRRQ